ncbi:MAG TPA: Gfo/Idh/MocA family oxidoreductase [Planctomycetota bacterium]|nr:Gfo/Idh/MocA family oxidoreductase [Planctomycetota bacterium]HRR79732.1 Gfo/Idh/MocA family oxidoreductase [Planctomycetota bacterium]HRT96388.1 Gfo/Idh/MocA family oxidoreductase [Planctomycetota bacterium]
MVGVAVIGAGNWGKNLVRNFAALPGAELRYVCDTNEKARLAMAQAYPKARAVTELAGPLHDPAVDAVVVAVDAPAHYAVAKAALEAGKHVYVEKPLTLAAAQAQELTDLAASRGRKLMVGHLLEYHPAVNYMKDLIARGTVGKTLYLYFQRVNLGIVRSTENAWWSLAPHDISVACYLFDATPASVSATGHAYLQEGIEDVVFANLKFADGRMAHIHVSWLDPHKIRKVTLVGSQKMVVFDDMDASEKIRIYDKGADVQRKSVESYIEAITLRTGDILIPQVPGGEPLQLECQHFIQCIVKDTKPRSDGADGVRVVRVLEAGSRSLAQGGEPARV